MEDGDRRARACPPLPHEADHAAHGPGHLLHPQRGQDLDRPVDRRGSDSTKWRVYGPDVLPLWTADMDFRARLLSDPRAAVAEFTGRELPEGVNIQFIENHLLIPILMKEGVAVRDAPPSDVMTEPVLSSLFDWPVSVHRLPEGSPQFVAERRPDRTRPA